MFKKKKSKKKEQDYTPSKGQTHFFDPASLEEYALPDLRAIALKFHHEVNRLEEVADERRAKLAEMHERQKKMGQELEAVALFKQHSENLQAMLQQQDVEMRKKQKELDALKKGQQASSEDSGRESTETSSADTVLVRKELEQVNHQLLEAETELKTLRERDQEAQEQARKQAHLIKEFETKFEEFMEEKDELLERMEELEAGQHKAHNDTESVRQQLYQQIQQREQHINLLKEEKHNLERENKSLSSTLDFLSQRKHELQERIKRMEEERNRDSQPLFERASIDAEGRSYRASQRTEDEQPQEVISEQDAAKLEVLCRELEDRNLEITSLREGIADLEVQHRAAKDELAEARKDRVQLQDTVNQQSAEMGAVKHKAVQQEKRVRELQAKRKAANQEIMKLQRTVERLQKVGGAVAGVGGGVVPEHVPFAGPPVVKEKQDKRQVMSLPPPSSSSEKIFVDKVKKNVEQLYKELVSYIFSGSQKKKDAVRLERQLTDIIMNMKEYLEDEGGETQSSSMRSGIRSPRRIGVAPPEILPAGKANRGKIAQALESIKKTPSRMFACIRPQPEEESKLQKPFKLPQRPPSAGPKVRR